MGNWVSDLERNSKDNMTRNYWDLRLYIYFTFKLALIYENLGSIPLFIFKNLYNSHIIAYNIYMYKHNIVNPDYVLVHFLWFHWCSALIAYFPGWCGLCKSCDLVCLFPVFVTLNLKHIYSSVCFILLYCCYWAGSWITFLAIVYGR